MCQTGAGRAFSIRPVREEDAESIVELLNPIIEAGIYSIMDRPVTADDQIEFIWSLPARSVYHLAVANDNGEVLGVQDVLPSAPGIDAFKQVGEISTFVSLKSQRIGIGRALTRETFQEAKRLDYQKLRATIRADNPSAIVFYQEQGFQIIGTAAKHAYVNGQYIDEILAERFLG